MKTLKTLVTSAIKSLNVQKEKLKLKFTPLQHDETLKGFVTVSIKNSKRFLPLVVVLSILSSCTNDTLVKQYKTLHEHDSLLTVQTQADDSTIKAYVYTMNDIQGNLDQIKSREKILTIKSESQNGNTAVSDIKTLDNLIIANHRELNSLEVKMKKLNKKDAGMENMIARLNTQLTQQDSEISTLQYSLAKVSNDYKQIAVQFNDSITVMQNQSAKIAYITTAMNTVYYAIGTVKELKDNKVINKNGGFMGIGRNTEMKPDFNASYFVKSDLTKLNVIALNAKFKKLISNHPSNSYKITGNDSSDSLWITNQSSFWSEDKYLVIAVK